MSDSNPTGHANDPGRLAWLAIDAQHSIYHKSISIDTAGISICKQLISRIGAISGQEGGASSLPYLGERSSTCTTLGRVTAYTRICETEHATICIEESQEVELPLHLGQVIVEVDEAKGIHRGGVGVHVNHKVERDLRIVPEPPHHLLDVVVLSVAP